MGVLFQDIRFAFRMLAKHPGFTMIVVLTLALGIGANTAIFSILNVAVLRPLPYEDPDELIVLSLTRDGEIAHSGMVSYTDLEDFRTQSESLANVVGLHGTIFNLSDENGVERIMGAYVSADFFSMLGVKPAEGRVFRPEEDDPGAERVVVISDGFRQRRFAGEQDLVGRTLILDGVAHTVVGIMPPDFRFPIDMRRAEAWTTTALDAATFPTRGSVRVKVVGRLRAGVSIAQATAELETIIARLAQEFPGIYTGCAVRIQSLHSVVTGKSRAPLLVLLSVVGLILLIACANVANMLLARSEYRRTEFAIRAALGAGRGTLVRQVLAEGLVLACLGGALGFLVAMWTLDALIVRAGSSAAGLGTITLDWQVLAFAALVTIAASLAISLIPALIASRPDLQASLKEGARSQTGRERRRLLAGLQVAEVAVAFVLLVGAGLLLRSLQHLMTVDPGFEPGNILTFQLSVPRSEHADPGQRARMYTEMIERLENLPGVQSVGASTSLPLHPASVSDSFGIVGRPAPESGVWPHARYDSISPGYFQTMGVPLLKGRMFSEQDDLEHPPVMIINETMARRYWPGKEPIGQQVALGSLLNDGSRAIFDVIGVVGDLHDTNLELDPQPCMYVCYKQQALRFMCFTLRTSVDPMSLVGPVRKEVAAVTREEAPFEFFSTDELLMRTVRQRSTVTLLLCIFASVAVGLSAIGMYGIISYSVARRTHEIGIRMAVGGQRGDVLRMILRQGLVLTGIGLAIGVAASVGMTQALRSMLYEISPTDPVTFIAVSTLLLAVALLACYMPARRAASVDPMVALRCE